MSVRIDKWLWAARFFKTRGLSTKAVNAGHVQCNGERSKASKMVRIGDEICIQRAQQRFAVRVIGLAEKRGSATQAQALYQETEASIAAREQQRQRRKLHADSSPAPDKRPDKKARRHIIRFIKRET